MKKCILFVLAVAVLTYFVNNGSLGRDVSQLQPVQILRITRQDGGILIETDFGMQGIGESIHAALEDLRRHSLSEVFLDTADYLLVDETVKEKLPQLMEELRPSCAVVIEEGKAKLEEAAQYLQTHRPWQTLLDYCAGNKEIPKLKTTEEGMALVP